MPAIVRRAVPHSLYRRYRQRKIAWQISQYVARDATHRYGGRSLTVRIADPLAEGWYDHDWDDPPYLAFARRLGLLGEGSTVFDIGAHQGVIALMIGADVGASGRVVAVEAEPHNARIAEINGELNAAQNLLVVNAAGGAEEGSTTFAEGLNGHVDETTSAGNVTVPTVTVDGLAAEHGRPDLVLVDVEGYEGRVLDGARATLQARSTSFFVEVHGSLRRFGERPEDILARLSGFDIYAAIGEDEDFAPLSGEPPRTRFFLIAVPAASR
jgi:FkbM family methyltransferase